MVCVKEDGQIKMESSGGGRDKSGGGGGGGGGVCVKMER